MEGGPKMQNYSFAPASWGKVGLAILPGLLALGTSWVVEAEDVIPTAGLGLCVLASTLGIIRERRIPPWTFATWGVLFSLLIRPVWLLLGPLMLLVVIVGLIWWVRLKHLVHLPESVRVLLYLMILLGAAVVLRFGPWVLFGGGAMLLVVAAGLPLARREGLSAGLFVAAVGFILWEQIFDLTYGLWKTPWGIIMVAILALLPLVVSPIWVLRSRSTRGQVWGLLLPSIVALAGVALINAIVRTDPTILEHIVNFRAMFPGDQFVYGISGGGHGRENLMLLLFRGCLVAAQLSVGMILTVVLYRWIEHLPPGSDDLAPALLKRSGRE
jgi:hypothetical protein